MSITYDQAAARLEQSALDLLTRMAELHLGTTGDRRFLDSSTLGGASLLFTDGRTSTEFSLDDAGALQELAGLGLLSVEYGGRDPVYRVTGEGRLFHQWLRERSGAAVAQTEAVVRTLVEGEAFAAAHPSAAHHLNEAFSLLWQDTQSTATMSEIGDHLRKAVMDITADVAADHVPGKTEHPADTMRAWLAQRPGLHVREREVLEALVTLTDKIVRLDNRITHVRDETDKGRPVPGRAELRRAAFLTAVCCYEIAGLTG